jgi:hypothetical protein
MLHATLSIHSEAVQQPRLVPHLNPKKQSNVETRMLLFD